LKYGHKPWEILPEILDYRAQPNLNAEDQPREQVDEVPTSVDPKEDPRVNPITEPMDPYQ
jgi:hypothetical protein